MPGEQNNIVDYIYSPDNVVYSKWKKKFVIIPKITITNKKIKFCWAYTRTRKFKIDPPQFPIHHMNRREWATADELVYLKLKGLDL